MEIIESLVYFQFSRVFCISKRVIMSLLEQHCCEATKDTWSINEYHITTFSPSTHSANVNPITEQLKELGRSIEDIKRVIRHVEDLTESLILIDAVQRLGLDHYFREEVKFVLEKNYVGIDPKTCPTLKHTSLLFRLLRQEGHYVPTDLFCNFMDEKGRFHEILAEDTDGLMELHEASHLDTGKEEILLEAANFTRKHLGEKVNLDESYEVVSNALEYPSQKSITKFTARRFLKDLQDIYPWVKPLKKLVKMEFEIMQRKHREEFHQISKWWKGLPVAEELKIARNQPLKWYTWAMASLEEPNLWEPRIELTKAISFIYAIDDIFDIYGTVDQLILFTTKVNRWEMDNLDELPNYMKICFISLDNLTNEIGNNIFKKYAYNPMKQLREAWKTLCNAFLEEAKWFRSNAQPKADKYLEVARVSSGVHIVMVHAFFLLGLGKIGEHEICLDDIKDITSSVATILRLFDDLGSAKDENQDGYDGSYIDYYMNEHEGLSRELVQKHILEIISNEWKILNKEQLRLSQYSASFARASLNIARLVPLMYSYDGNQRLPVLEEYIKSILFDDNN